MQTISPIKNAFVARLRTSTALKDGLTGGIHEGIALVGKKPPYLIYNVLPATREYDFTSTDVFVTIDAIVYSYDTDEAQNLDQLAADVLDDAPLIVSGQSILLCHRVLDLSSPGEDEQGRKVYASGGSYEIWADQAR